MGSDLRDMRPKPTRPESRAWYGHFAADINDVDELASVIIPEFDPYRSWGPARWQSRGDLTLPNKGNECIVLMDNRMNLWILSWWPGISSVPPPVDTADIADGAVTTPKLHDAAVTIPKLSFDPATQSELDAHTSLTTTAHGGILSSSDPVLGGIVPIGSIIDWGGSADPAGGKFLICDGRSLDRATYATLFSILGTTYGFVDASHFNVPDLRGRVAVGVDGAAGRLAANDALGNSSGEEKHTLTLAEAPAHAHNVTLTLFSGGSFGAVDANDRPARMWGGTPGGGVAFGAAVDSQGGGAAHNVMQPYLVTNKIIRVL